MGLKQCTVSRASFYYYIIDKVGFSGFRGTGENTFLGDILQRFVKESYLIFSISTKTRRYTIRAQLKTGRHFCVRKNKNIPRRKVHRARIESRRMQPSADTELYMILYGRKCARLREQVAPTWNSICFQRFRSSAIRNRI